MERVYRDLPGLDPKKALALQRWTRQYWNLPAMTLPIRTPRASRVLRTYSSLMSKTYEAIREVSGCAIVIDSSKSGFHGLILRRASNIELCVLHLVRDSRAVAFSRAREKLTNPNVKSNYMQKYGFAKSAVFWNLQNAGAQALGLGRGNYKAIRYEDLAASPKKVLVEILDFIGYTLADPASLNFIDGSNVNLKVNHIVSGNPMRFERGMTGVRPDMEWQQKMNTRQKFLVTALTWPILLRYGYLHR